MRYFLILLLPLVLAVADCSEKSTSTIGDGFTDCTVRIDSDGSEIKVKNCDNSDNSVTNNEIVEPEG